MENNKKKFTSVSIPTFLFDKAKEKSVRSGFPSVSAYVGYIIREVISENSESGIISEDASIVKNRLRALGYIDEE